MAFNRRVPELELVHSRLRYRQSGAMWQVDGPDEADKQIAGHERMRSKTNGTPEGGSSQPQHREVIRP